MACFEYNVISPSPTVERPEVNLSTNLTPERLVVKKELKE